MKSIAELEKHIDNASCITIAVHTHPDGDAIGSGSALVRYLVDCRGKDAVLVVPDEIPASLSFLASEANGRILVMEDEPDKVSSRIGSSDLLFCLDCNAFDRTAGAEPLLAASKAPKILIDHHLNPDTESFDLVFSQTGISSTCELLYWILKETSDIAGDASRLPASSRNALMTGMTTDTNNFANSVVPSTLVMASELLDTGVDRDAILSNLYNRYRENRILLMGHMLGEKMKITPQGVAYMILDKATQLRYDFKEGEAEGFVNIPLAIEKVRMSIFLTEEKDRFRVSIRSKRGTSANTFAMKCFNGGGHELAAGGKLLVPQNISGPEDAEAYILNVIDRFL